MKNILKYAIVAVIGFTSMSCDKEKPLTVNEFKGADYGTNKGSITLEFTGNAKTTEGDVIDITGVKVECNTYSISDGSGFVVEGGYKDVSRYSTTSFLNGTFYNNISVSRKDLPGSRTVDMSFTVNVEKDGRLITLKGENSIVNGTLSVSDWQDNIDAAGLITGYVNLAPEETDATTGAQVPLGYTVKVTFNNTQCSEQHLDGATR